MKQSTTRLEPPSTSEKAAAPLNRRQFLKTSALAVATTAVAAPRLVAADTSPKKIRIGVVGGGFGASFQWHEHPDCIVEAVSDLRPERRERLMKTYKCAKSYDSLEELVRDPKIDAVAIFTDGPLHVQHVVECMKHGKHAISAVPAAWGSLEQAELLFATVKKHGLTPIARIVSYGGAAQDPEWFTTAPIPAMQKALERSSWKAADVDLWEINEAFSVVTMAAMKDLGLDHAKVNMRGGAASIGHPIGASGARILVTLLHLLEDRKLKKGCASLCIGGGEALALTVER